MRTFVPESLFGQLCIHGSTFFNKSSLQSIVSSIVSWKGTTTGRRDGHSLIGTIFLCLYMASSQAAPVLGNLQTSLTLMPNGLIISDSGRLPLDEISSLNPTLFVTIGSTRILPSTWLAGHSDCVSPKSLSFWKILRRRLHDH